MFSLIYLVIVELNVSIAIQVFEEFVEERRMSSLSRAGEFTLKSIEINLSRTFLTGANMG